MPKSWYRSAALPAAATVSAAPKPRFAREGKRCVNGEALSPRAATFSPGGTGPSSAASHPRTSQ